MKYQGKESDFQITCISYLRKYYKDLLVIHCPNEGISAKNKNALAYGAKRKAMGVISGVPDMLIFNTIILHGESYFDTTEIKGLAIELKVEGGKVSNSQNEFMDRLTDRNWVCEVCYSVDEFINTIEKYYGKV